MPVGDLHSQLQHFKLLGGNTAVDLWPVINLVLPAWLLLALAPRWKHTATLTLIPPVVHAVIYVGAFLSLTLYPEKPTDGIPDVSTLEGVVQLFQDPNGVFVGWEHYVCFDLLVGRMITFHSVIMDGGIVFHIFVVIPGLFLTLMAGPLGWLYYLLLSSMLLDLPVDQIIVAPRTRKTTTTTAPADAKKNVVSHTPTSLKTIEEEPGKTTKSSPRKNKKGNAGKQKNS